MNFALEHTLVGQVGHLLVVIAFVSSLSAIFSYISAGNSEIKACSWNTLSRWLFGVHSFAAVSLIVLLFMMIANHYFEYHYVWKYSSLSMEARYIFSCFWSGQEGSLLLWSFWIIVFSWFVVGFSGHWEKYVMPFVLVVQAFIFSMLLGVYVGDVKIGSSPFILIRELPENAGMPWAKMGDYLQRITSFQDGVGLNPLLQNYWMTIHPPVLFSGFAATLFPFAFALAGISRRNYYGWVKPALGWGIFGTFALGAGILLGGAWAYESLSFGGFWAWDPVENASLVPWILLVTGVHCLQVTYKRKRAAFLSILFSTSPFLLVVYSTFLTRSGILGESSVHSFTENGLFIHLLVFLFILLAGTILVILDQKKLRIYFITISVLSLTIYFTTDNLSYTLPVWLLSAMILLLLYYEKYFPRDQSEMHKTSREFWMLAGGLFLLMSAIQITVSTSIPVINKIFGSRLDAFTDLPMRNAFYHTWQMPVAIVVLLLMGITRFLQYRKTEAGIVSNKVRFSILIILPVVAITSFVLGYRVHEWQFVLLLFAAILAITMNVSFVRRMWRQSNISGGSNVAHIGFALILLGVLISGSRKSVISRNTANFSLEELNSDFRNDENVLLKQGDTLLMNDYFVTYCGRDKQNGKLHYEVKYFHPRKENNVLIPGKHAFTLYPVVQLNEQFGNVAEPGTKHFFDHDVFTHIKYADMEPDHLRDGYSSDGFMGETMFKMNLGAVLNLENYRFRFDDIYLVDTPGEKQELGLEKDDIVVKTVIKVVNLDLKDSTGFVVEPLFVVRDSMTVISRDIYSNELDAKIRIVELPQESNTIVLGIRQREFIVMQALIFPGMNILWTGCAMMLLGCLMSLKKYVWKVKTRENSLPVTTANPVLK